MPIEITALTEADIPGAIDTIQQAFADDPYNRWIFNDRSKVCLLLLSHARLALTPRDSSLLPVTACLSGSVASGAFTMRFSLSPRTQHPMTRLRSSAPQCGCLPDQLASKIAGMNGCRVGGSG